MARVTEFESVVRQRPYVHETVRCTHFTFDGDDGRRYLVLETYGSSHRQERDKVSQSLQVDEDAAAKLIALLREAFPKLR